MKIRHALTTALLAPLVAIGAGVTMAVPAHAVECTSRGAELGPGGTLLPGECLRSANTLYALHMQTNGDLVLAENRTNRVCWRSSDEGATSAGDQVYFNALTKGDYTESRLSVDSPGLITRYSVTYSDVKPPFQQRSYTLSVNGNGQLWVGYDLHRSC